MGRSAGMVHVAGSTSALLGVAMLAAATLDCTDGGTVALRLAGIGAVAIGVGLGLRRTYVLPGVVAPTSILATMLAVFVVAVLWSLVVYVLTDTIVDPVDAVFESIAGFSTTALSVLDQPEEVPRGVLAWRSLTQWFGGLGAVVALVGLLPELGVGAPEPGLTHSHEQPWRRSNRHLDRLLRRLVGVYGGLTIVGVALLAASGLGPYDAWSVSLTTVSTGGFSDHQGSIAHYDSAAVEWVVLGGMAVAGASLALLWRSLSGAMSGFLRSVELRAYVALLVVAGVAAVVGTAPVGGPTHTSVRQALFSVTSVVSTTGHTVTDWTEWGFGLQALLVGLMAIGAMSGSPGGGFTVLRAVTMGGLVRREIVRQLDPNSVVVVKVGRQTIGESVISRMVGFQILSVLFVMVGAVSLAVTGVDLVGAGAGAVSSLSTVGPALGDLGPGRSMLGRSLGTQVTLMVLMTAGRLEIYPVARAGAAVASTTRAVIGRLRRRPG